MATKERNNGRDTMRFTADLAKDLHRELKLEAYDLGISLEQHVRVILRDRKKGEAK